MHIASLPPAVHFINCNQYAVSQHLSCLLCGTAGDFIRPLKHWTKRHTSQVVPVGETGLCAAPAPHLSTDLIDWFLSHAYAFELHYFEFFHFAWNFCSHTHC